jgi:hypothetical protein
MTWFKSPARKVVLRTAGMLTAVSLAAGGSTAYAFAAQARPGQVVPAWSPTARPA